MLTTKKRNFADVWMTGENKTRSAIKAGYSAASAKYKGHELSKNAEVLAYIERIKSLAVKEPEPEPEPVTVIEAESVPEVMIPESLSKNANDDPLEVMRKIMKDNIFTDPKLSLDAAAKLAPYVSAKIGETGKKEAKNSAAKKAANAFTSMAPPKLVINNRI